MLKSLTYVVSNLIAIVMVVFVIKYLTPLTLKMAENLKKFGQPEVIQAEAAHLGRTSMQYLYSADLPQEGLTSQATFSVATTRKSISSLVFFPVKLHTSVTNI